MSQMKFNDDENSGKKRIRAWKYVNLYFTSSVVVLSISLATAAFIIKQNLAEYDDFLYYYGSVTTLCVLLGSLISIVTALWGCYAVHKECLLQLFVFSSVMGIIALTHAIISILYVSYLQELLDSSIETLFDMKIKIYKENPIPIDSLQRSLECCGKNNASDWFQYSKFIPSSCCPHKSNETEPCRTEDFFTMYHNGCIPKLERIPMTSVQIIRMLFMGLQISEIITVFTVLLFCWQITTSSKTTVHKEVAY